jgi:ATP-dependent DNA ligase
MSGSGRVYRNSSGAKLRQRCCLNRGFVFDVLAIDARAVHRRHYWERRGLLEPLELNSDHCSTAPSHRDGEALWEKVCALGLEGVVAKKRSGHYLPRQTRLDQKPRLLAYPLEV